MRLAHQDLPLAHHHIREERDAWRPANPDLYLLPTAPPVLSGRDMAGPALSLRAINPGMGGE